MNSRVTFFLICMLTKWFMLLDKIITTLFGIILAQSSFWGTKNHPQKTLKTLLSLLTMVSGNCPIFQGFHRKVGFSRVFDSLEQHLLIFEGFRGSVRTLFWDQQQPPRAAMSLWKVWFGAPMGTTTHRPPTTGPAAYGSLVPHSRPHLDRGHLPLMYWELTD